MSDLSMEGLPVYQDSITGWPLRCGAHQGRDWCGCRSTVITEGGDGITLWHTLLIHHDDSTTVDVNITKDTIVAVRLDLAEQWQSDRDETQMYVSLESAGIANHEPFVANPSLLKLGTLNYGEGRGVLRELVINRFAGIFVNMPLCKSRLHGPDEFKAYSDSRSHPARAWNWDYLTWENNGMCPPCFERYETLINSAKDFTARESRPSPNSGTITSQPWTTRGRINPNSKRAGG